MKEPQIRIYTGKIHIWTENLEEKGRRRESACGRLLLALGLCEMGRGELLRGAEHFSEVLDILDSLTIEGEHGKPCFREYPWIQFNISHSGGYGACAVTSIPCGLDIQEIRKFRGSRILERTMTEQEQKQIRSSPDPYLEFSRLWAKKERMVKLTGEGLTRSLKELETPAWLVTFEHLPAYTGCICADTRCQVYIEEAVPERLEQALRKERKRHC